MRLSRVIGLEIVGQDVLRVCSSSSACDDGGFDDKSMAFKESILCVSVVLGNVRGSRGELQGAGEWDERIATLKPVLHTFCLSASFLSTTLTITYDHERWS
jgi:hypothetical protein